MVSVCTFSRRRILGVLLALTLLPGLASAGTMTFVNLWSGHTNYVEDGLRVTSNAAMYLDQAGGVQAMFPSTTWQTMTLALEAGEPFTLTSIDMSGYSSPPHSIVFVGELSGGGTVTTTITTDDVAGYETMMFPPSFTNLTSVSWDHSDPTAYCVYDNIVAVPYSPVSTESSTWGAVKALY